MGNMLRFLSGKGGGGYGRQEREMKRPENDGIFIIQ